LNYSPYGFTQRRRRTLLLYTGEACEVLQSCYLLGNGRRVYSATLMRFLGPDPFSPFSLGGRNVYAYCAGDPINNVDRNGYSPVRIISQAGGLVYGSVGMLSALNKTSKHIVKRSIAVANGLTKPPEFGTRERAINALIFNGSAASTLSKAPSAILAFGFNASSTFDQAVTLFGFGGATAAGVGKGMQLYADMKATIIDARKHRLPLLKLASESIKEAVGYNLMRGRESAIIAPRPETVLAVVTVVRDADKRQLHSRLSGASTDSGYGSGSEV